MTNLEYLIWVILYIGTNQITVPKHTVKFYDEETT